MGNIPLSIVMALINTKPPYGIARDSLSVLKDMIETGRIIPVRTRNGKLYFFTPEMLEDFVSAYTVVEHDEIIDIIERELDIYMS